jgi:hypothetical protein
MKIWIPSLLILASLSAFAAPSSEQHQPAAINSAIKLSAGEGPLCSDGSRCDAKYSHCCDIKGTPTCVTKLSDCHE